ncbi:MAG: hypothetical protein WD851_02605 [Pirellulales bacterium]
MPRYVLLRHELPPQSGRASHWDFMLEHEGVLWTWALEQLPKLWLVELNLPHEDASDEVPARRLADHRLAYLEYEGLVSGDRGSVNRVTQAGYSIITNNADLLEVTLDGDLHGLVILTRRNESIDEWRLRIERERYEQKVAKDTAQP